MNKQILDELAEEYRKTRERNESLAEEREAEAIAKCPRIGELLEERHTRILKAAARMFSGGAAEEDPESVIRGCNGEIRALLRENGLPEDYLQPIFTCEACRDTGYIGDSVRRPCACLTEAYRRRAEGSEMPGQSFEAFDLSVFPEEPIPQLGMTQRQWMAQIRDKCEKFADSVPAPKQRTLTITGRSGLGKTWLLGCIRNRVTRNGIDSVYVTAYRALEILRDSYFNRDEGSDEARRLFTVPLLMIDDLGMEPMMQNITIEQMYNLLNERMVNGLCTVISTNLTVGDIRERYNERIASRLQDKLQSSILPLMGEDLRKRV